jgi:hypothetical protein
VATLLTSLVVCGIKNLLDSVFLEPAWWREPRGQLYCVKASWRCVVKKEKFVMLVLGIVVTGLIFCVIFDRLVGVNLARDYSLLQHLVIAGSRMALGMVLGSLLAHREK